MPYKTLHRDHPLGFSFRLFSLLLLLSTLLYGFYAWHMAKAEKLRQLYALADFTSKAAELFFDRYTSAEYLLSRQLQAAGNLEDAGQVRALLKDFLKANPDLAAVSIVLPNGQIWLSTAGQSAQSLPNLSKIMANWHQPQAGFSKENAIIGRPHPGAILGRWIIPVLYPVKDPQGKLLYVISANVSLSHQQALWRYVRLPEDSQIGLIRDDGYLASCWPDDRRPEAIFGKPRLGPALKEMHQIRDDAIHGGTVRIGDNVRFGAYSRMKSYPMTAFVLVSWSSIVKGWFQQIQVPLLIILMLFIGVAFIFRRAAKQENLLELQRQQAVNQLAYSAHHDSLTGLPNRARFQEYCLQAMARANRQQRLLALLFLDLDHFKPVNDRLGHQWGDQLLKAVADRFLQSLRTGDLVARVGGDEFTVLLEGVANRDEVETCARRLVKALSQPFILGTETVELGVSIGISCYPQDADNIDQLLKYADGAMYHVKNAGGDGFRFHAMTAV